METTGTVTSDSTTQICSQCRMGAGSSEKLTTWQTWTNALRRRTLHFTPSWFSVNMGTGITSILLHNLPFQAAALRYIADTIFILNVLLFLLFLTLTLVRYAVWPRVFPIMLLDAQQSLFLGTLPMGLATIVNMVATVCVPAFGPR
jgi:tellurite resistance protein TehA-like permease